MRAKKSLSDDKVKELNHYKAALNYQSYLEEMNSALVTYYTDLSTSFIQRIATYANSNPTVILWCSYGGAAGAFLMIFTFEILFCCCRGSRALRILINTTWFICAAAAVGVAVFLNILVPVIGSMSELGLMMQPTMYNVTFFGKLEFPSEMVRGHLYPCVFGCSL